MELPLERQVTRDTITAGSPETQASTTVHGLLVPQRDHNFSETLKYKAPARPSGGAGIDSLKHTTMLVMIEDAVTTAASLSLVGNATAVSSLERPRTPQSPAEVAAVSLSLVSVPAAVAAMNQQNTRLLHRSAHVCVSTPVSLHAAMTEEHDNTMQMKGGHTVPLSKMVSVQQGAKEVTSLEQDSLTGPDARLFQAEESSRTVDDGMIDERQQSASDDGYGNGRLVIEALSSARQGMHAAVSSCMHAVCVSPNNSSLGCRCSSLAE